MNTEFFIAKRIISEKKEKKGISQPIVTIAVIGISLGLAVMILAVAIASGFKTEISNKLIGFGSHIQIINYDTNISYETAPIKKDQPFFKDVKNLKGVNKFNNLGLKQGLLKPSLKIFTGLF